MNSRTNARGDTPAQRSCPRCTGTDLRTGPLEQTGRLWSWTIQGFEPKPPYAADGPFLLGAWSIADAFYAPVATRFRSYGVKLSDHGDTGPAGAYCETLLETPEYLEWEKAALAEG